MENENNSQLPKGDAPSLPRVWKIKKLGEIAKINYGYTEKASYKKIGPKFLRITDIQNNNVNWENVPYSKCNKKDFKKYKLETGDIVFARTGATTGKSYLIVNPPSAVFASYLIRLKFLDKENFFTKFVSYFFNTDYYWKKISEGIAGSAQGGFNATKLGELNFQFPPLPEQKRIVAILDRAFSAIEQAKANAEQNLKNAKELFQSKLQQIFDSGKLLVVSGEWEEKRFDEICVLQRGFDLPTRLRKKGVYPLVSSNGITDYIDVWKVKAPGVSTGRSGTIGKVHFIEKDYWPLNTSLYIKEFHGNYERCVFYFLIQFDLSKYASGAGVPTLNRNNVHSEKIWFPKKIEIQKQIVAQLDKLQAETKKLEVIYQKKIDNLEELKKSVLQKAFLGQL